MTSVLMRRHAVRIARLVQIALVLLAGLAGASLWAHGAEPPSPAARAIGYRHALYTAVGYNVGELRAMLEGKTPYDAARFATVAEHVAALVPLLPEAFPAGSDAGAPTAAKPQVWSEWPDFERRLGDLSRASSAFAAVARRGDLATIRPAFAELTQQCKACHDHYKRED